MKVLRVLVFTLLSMSVTVNGQSEDTPEPYYTIRAAVGHNPQSSWVKALMRFKDDIETSSKGRIQVNIYHSGQLGSTRQVLEMVYLDAIDIAVPGAAQVEAYVPEVGVVVLPFIWQTEEQMFKALDGELGDVIEKEFKKMNFHGLGWFANGFRCITNSRKPIESVEDVEGLKIRVIPSPAVMQYFKSVGAEPTHIDWVELYEALKMGVVDAQENPPFFVYLGRMHEVQKYYSLTKHMNEPGVVVMNRRFYDKLPKDLQVIVDKAGKEAALWQHEQMQKDNLEMLNKLKDSGKIEINELSEEALEQFRRIAREKAYPVIMKKKLCGQNTKSLIESILSSQEKEHAERN